MSKKKKPGDLGADGDELPDDLAGDGIERAGDDGADGPESLAEDERAELARLRAENAALRAAQPAAAVLAAAPPIGPVSKWIGNIKHGVPIVVEAPSSLHAEQEYKRVAGILYSEHPIEVQPAPPDAELGPVEKR